MKIKKSNVVRANRTLRLPREAARTPRKQKNPLEEAVKQLPSKPEMKLHSQLNAIGLEGQYVTEYEFHTYRLWRLDVAFLPEMLAIEVMGGGYVGGRHHRNDGYNEDCAKMAECICLGWRVMYVTPEQINSGKAISWIQRALEFIRSRRD